ncbi:MAG: ammonia-forming cytochrome c nitrite reductase subunit c552, partial [Candidatus Hydrogenedentes bacterium]|nr:ammonia-forming cytochrome c nitrite reductase subunit c552 [Candidatus Hydrogenedentota bacterium]
MSFKTLLIFVLLVAVLAGAGALGFRYLPNLDQLGARVSTPTVGGQCADCHRRDSVAIVHQFEGSRHAGSGVTCIDCHQPVEGQEQYDHRGIALARNVTPLNCAQCHAAEYREYLRSRHAAPAWAAVTGPADFTEEQVQFAESLHPGTIRRDSKQLAALEGSPVMTAGCKACHDVGRPNPDGSIGSCIDCHTAHSDSIALARHPDTCAQCHTGAGQIGADIYRESRHGLLFEAGLADMNLADHSRDLGV